MKAYRLITLIVIILGMFLFTQCSDVPTAVDNDVNQQKLSLKKGGNGNGNGGGGNHDGSLNDDGGDDDSDRPPWAGDPSQNPHIGKNPDSGTKKGGFYGDLYILWRNDNGEPILDAEGRVQPIAFVNNGFDDEGNPILSYDGEGFPIEYASEGEPGFTLEYDSEGDLIVSDAYAPCTVDFGRINIVRSPPSVLQSGLDEAIKTLTASNVIEITVDFCGRLTAVISELDENGDNIRNTIDSPRENLALYQELLLSGFGGSLSFLSTYFSSDEDLDIAASCFAAGSDKSSNVIVDEIVYCNTFLGINETSGPGVVTGYYNFSGYSYDRSVYDHRWITHKYEYPGTPKRISDVVGFTAKWGSGPWSSIAAFRTAADDAVQVLEFVHSDTNIEYQWGYDPAP